jgi:hypothetical protein
MSSSQRTHCRSITSLGGLGRTAAGHDPKMTVARAAFASSFEKTIRERFPDLDDEVEIARRADALRRLHYAKLAFRSAQARRKRSARARATDSRSDGAPDDIASIVEPSTEARNRASQ